MTLPPLETGITWGKSKYGWHEYEVGQSRLYGREFNHDSIRANAWLYGRRHGIRFQARTEREGLRVLRIA